MKKLGNILFYTLNTFFIGGLLAFAIIFWMMGDRFHAIIDALYLLIIVEIFYLRRKCKLLQKDNNSLQEDGKRLIEQKNKLTQKLSDRESYYTIYICPSDSKENGMTVNIPNNMMVISVKPCIVTEDRKPYETAAVGQKYYDMLLCPKDEPARGNTHHVYILSQPDFQNSNIIWEANRYSAVSARLDHIIH